MEHIERVLAFGLGVLVLDGRTVFAELRYLRALVRPPEPTES